MPAEQQLRPEEQGTGLIVSVILNNILTRLDGLDDRIDHMSRSFEAFASKMHSAPCADLTKVNGAFVKDEDGGPDFYGHREDHRARKTSSDEIRSMLRKIAVGVSVVMILTIGGAIYAALEVAAVARIQAIKDRG